jgi:hypothetical protein
VDRSAQLVCGTPAASGLKVEFPAPSGYAQDFQRDGYAVIPALLSREVATRWCKQALHLERQFGIDIRRDAADHPLSYRVVTGEVIRDHWPELYSFYVAKATSDWIAQTTGEPRIGPSVHIRSAININILRHPGHVYRWHFDAVPHTLIIFLTNNESQDGGILQMLPGTTSLPEEDSEPTGAISVLPSAGAAVLMDGARCCHRVTPILRQCLRISVPLVYPAIEEANRPPGLDDYLYRES